MNIPGRINRILLLVLCIIRALFHGAANKIPLSVSRIIVVPTGKLGDVVCTTPVLYAIRTHFPRARLIVAGTTKLHRPLLSGSGLVDEYLDLEERGAVARIKRCRAEVGLVTGFSFKSAALMYIAGIPLVVAARVEGGVSPFETRPYKILKRFIKTFPYRMGEYAPRERLKVLEPLGIISSDTKKHLGFSKDADKKVKQFFIDNGIDIEKDFVVGISPSAGNKIKEWPEERFAQVADYLIEKHQARIVLTGEPDDEQRVQEVIKNVKNSEDIINTQGQFNMDELKALISKLNLFISVDTGPIYIAEAFDVPTVDIVGPMDEHVQPPSGLIHRNVVPPDRVRPELSILNARLYNVDEAIRQTLSITVSAVLEETEKLIRDIHARMVD